MSYLYDTCEFPFEDEQGDALSKSQARQSCERGDSFLECAKRCSYGADEELCDMAIDCVWYQCMEE